MPLHDVLIIHSNLLISLVQVDEKTGFCDFGVETGWAGTPMNARQTLVLNRVLDGMEGKLTNAKWAAIGKCSADTALRDINDLLARGVLGRLEGRGRSTGYELCVK